MESTLWSEDPLILIEPKYFTQFFPNKKSQTPEEYENSMIRLSFYTNLLLAIYYDNFLLPSVSFSLVLLYFYVFPTTPRTVEKLEHLVVQECTKPTLDNPFMNRTPINPAAPPACPITQESKEEMHTYFQNNLYRDVSDVFGKKSSERNFYTTPHSYSDWDSQTKFAKWLYNNEQICKSDQNYCVPYIDPRNQRRSTNI